MALFRPFPTRVLVSIIAAWFAMFIHTQIFDNTNPVGMVLSWLVFVALAIAATGGKRIGAAIGWAVPLALIPPIVLMGILGPIGARDTWSPQQESLLIGAVMVLYSVFMLDKLTAEPAPAPAPKSQS